ncbi:MAG: signal recognition particle protein [Acidobacteria bacterium]|nr:MAG: signal recognition particle protein [Acidobacteriota bacterium]
MVFESLSERLRGVVGRVRGSGRITEKDLDEALREIRVALLEADVAYRVVREFLARVREKSLGQEVLRSLTPGQQVVRIVRDELVRLLGGSDARTPLRTSPHPPSVYMLAGLQGSGKTTTAAKLGRWLAGRGRHPLVAPVDLQRPAAVLQAIQVARQAGVAAFEHDGTGDPVSRAREAVTEARRQGFDVVLLDTAGRLHVDDDLMDELVAIRDAVEPVERLYVADAMTGQDAVRSAAAFHERIGLTGVVLTKLDGDARGGAALSVAAVTGVPVRFAGVGEKTDALEPFDPERMAGRILGMGDVLGLIERAEAAIDREEAKRIERSVRSRQFTLETFRDALRQMRRMGPLQQILGMLPGAALPPGVEVDEREVVRMEAIIDSMTREERANWRLIDGSRRRRIARGSGTRVQDVNRLLKQFMEMQKMMKRLDPKRGRRGLRGLLGR